MPNIQNRMTSGKVLPQLIRFAMPILVANFLQQFYSIVDMLIVGQFTGNVGLSAVTTGSNLTTVLTCVCIGLAVGGEVMVAQHVGALDNKGKSEVIGTLFTMSILAAFFMGLIALLIYKPMLGLMNVPEAAQADAGAYTLMSIFGVLFIFGYNSICAVLRGMGDAKRPMYIIGISAVCNIVLDYIFVGPLGMRAFGAALATVISQGVSCVIAVVYLYRKREQFGFDFSLGSFRPKADKLRKILKIGIPTSVEMVIVNISFMYIISMVNIYGTAASAAYGVGNKVDAMLRIVGSAVGTAASTIEAQCIGAGDTKRTSRVLAAGLVLGLSLNTVAMLAVRLWPAQIFALFDNDPGTISYGLQYVRIMSWSYWAFALMNTFNGLARAVGNTVLVLIGSILDGVALRLGLAYLLGTVAGLGLDGVYIGLMLAPYGAALVAGIYYFSGRWKTRKLIEQDEQNLQPSEELL